MENTSPKPENHENSPSSGQAVVSVKNMVVTTDTLDLIVMLDEGISEVNITTKHEATDEHTGT